MRISCCDAISPGPFNDEPEIAIDASKLSLLPNGPTANERHGDGMRDAGKGKPRASENPSYLAGYDYAARERAEGRNRPTELPAARSFYAG